MSEASFREEQRCPKLLPVAILLLATLPLLSLLGYALVQQLGRGVPWGDRPVSNGVLIALALFGALVLLGLPALFASARLSTEVRPDGLYLRFAPLHRSFRRIPLEGVTSVRAITYRPIRDFGGWGIRQGRKGRAYNLRGDRGLELLYSDGQRLVIGSLQPEALAAAVAPLAPVKKT